MTTGYYCAIFPFFLVEEKKKTTKKQRHFIFYDWATTGIPVNRQVALGEMKYSNKNGLYNSETM